MNWIERFFGTPRFETIKSIRRIIVFVIGGSILLIGIALIVLPGPAFVVIPIGLAILATEFAWARHWLKKARRLASRITSEQEGEK
jgi:tellurite resistance protein TerC